ncbi:MAG TPA: efflux RND transporter periplasmic adaptor subunit [Acetobacteraceae bacterium]|nr:efflux RND transporter periplasmic adaptor subunit [Acetobacteraceae bacterium]
MPIRPSALRGAALLLTTLLALTACKKENAYVPPPPPEVGVAKPLQQAVTPYLEVTGNTVAFNQVDLQARIQGFLQEINYTDGSMTTQGTTLFVIEPAPYKAQLDQAQATLASAQAKLVQSQAELTRQSTLLRQNVSAQNTYDQALAKRDSDRADVMNQQGAVTIAAINYGYTRVTAPFDGEVTNHLQSIGSLVGVGAPTKLATVVQLDPIYVNFNVSEQDVLRIKQMMRERNLKAVDLAKIPVEVGLMTEQGYPHLGALNYASPTLDPSTGTLFARGLLANPDRVLLPGMFVRIRIPVAIDKKQSMLVPDEALGTDQGGRYLLVLGKDNTVEQRKVTVGSTVGSLRVIESGLQPEDQVIVSGLARAIPGEKVSPKETTITNGKS